MGDKFYSYSTLLVSIVIFNDDFFLSGMLTLWVIMGESSDESLSLDDNVFFSTFYNTGSTFLKFSESRETSETDSSLLIISYDSYTVSYS